LFSLGLDLPRRLTLSLGAASRVRVRRAVAATMLVLSAFVSVVHLGHDVKDGHRTFRSIYSAEELDALAADRAARWRSDPPVELKRLSAEDQYMSEGLWHVQRRNRAWDAGDASTAFQENLILERFFAPVLDTPSYVSRTGHRWAAAHRQDAESRAQAASARGSALPAEPAPYVSDAHLIPIFTWPRRAFWLVAAVLLIIAAGARLKQRKIRTPIPG
jgi:hypothetical protein